MLSDRLPLALERGLIEVPDSGQIAVFGVGADQALADLPLDRLHIIHPMAPDALAWRAAGLATRVAPEGRYALSILCLPRARAAAEALIATARDVTDGPVLIDGAKTDGIDRMLKTLRKRGDVSEALSKAHGKIFALRGGDFADWRAGPRHIEGGFVTPPGGFSADGIDPGSAALAASLPLGLAGHVVDLGAGWGYLSAEILTREAVTRVDLVEADYTALEAARLNVLDPRAAFHWADARMWQGSTADHVVTNPPFHTGRKGDTGLGQDFIRKAAQLLKPSGCLWLVANRHLPYEKTLDAAFAHFKELDGTGAFKLFQATKPRHHSRMTSKG